MSLTLLGCRIWSLLSAGYLEPGPEASPLAVRAAHPAFSAQLSQAHNLKREVYVKDSKMCQINWMHGTATVFPILKLQKSDGSLSFFGKWEVSITRDVYSTQVCALECTLSEIPFLSIVFPWNKDPMTCKCQVTLDTMDHFNEICSIAELLPQRVWNNYIRNLNWWSSERHCRYVDIVSKKLFFEWWTISSKSKSKRFWASDVICLPLLGTTFLPSRLF